jgi:response regulator RpfG family c-di-GMP phosphodiesterase
MTAVASEPFTIIVLDSTEATLENHKKLFAHLPGTGVSAFSESAKALQSANNNGVDLFVVSLGTVGESAALIKELRRGQPAVGILAIAKEAAVDKDQRRELYEAGAAVLLEQRPIDPMVYLNAARTALSHTMLRREDNKRIKEAQDKIASVYTELEKREAACLEALAQAAGLVDPELPKRMAGVALVARQIAQQLRLEDAKRLEAATKVYDIGMIALPEALRAKRNQPMHDNDAKAFQAHVAKVGQIFGGTPTGLMGLAWAVASSHHERFDGTGYPNGTAGDKIPLYARIVAVAEAFYDATRPTGNIPASPIAGLQKVQRQELTAFDPAVVAALGRAVEAMGAAAAT